MNRKCDVRWVFQSESVGVLIGWGGDSGVGGTKAGRGGQPRPVAQLSVLWGSCWLRRVGDESQGRGCSFWHAPAEWGLCFPLTGPPGPVRLSLVGRHCTSECWFLWAGYS